MDRKKTLVMSLVGLFVMLISLVSVAGCGTLAEVSAELGQQVEIRLGQTVSVQGESIDVKFFEIIGDSRCPTGATCVWQGEISGVLEITYLDETYQMTITQPGLSGEMVTEAFAEYAIGYNFLPYPEVGQEIKYGDYRLEIVINKAVT